MRTLKVEELSLVAGARPRRRHNAGVREHRSSKNNGLGNGNQGAPGGSYPNNNAENANPPVTATGTSTSGFPIDSIRPTVNPDGQGSSELRAARGREGGWSCTGCVVQDTGRCGSPDSETAPQPRADAACPRIDADTNEGLAKQKVVVVDHATLAALPASCRRFPRRQTPGARRPLEEQISKSRPHDQVSRRWRIDQILRIFRARTAPTGCRPWSSAATWSHRARTCAFSVPRSWRRGRPSGSAP